MRASGRAGELVDGSTDMWACECVSVYMCACFEIEERHTTARTGKAIVARHSYGLYNYGLYRYGLYSYGTGEAIVARHAVAVDTP